MTSRGGPSRCEFVVALLIAASVAMAVVLDSSLDHHVDHTLALASSRTLPDAGTGVVHSPPAFREGSAAERRRLPPPLRGIH